MLFQSDMQLGWERKFVKTMAWIIEPHNVINVWLPAQTLQVLIGIFFYLCRKPFHKVLAH